jgi:outer membrane protein assembly factor BamB
MRTLRSLTAKTPSQCLWTARGSACAIAAHEGLVLVGCGDGTLRAYTADGSLVASRLAHSGSVIAVGFARDPATGAARVVSVGLDRRAVVSDLALVQRQTLELPAAPKWLATSARSSRVAMVLAEGPVLSWTLDDAPRPWSASTHEPITGLVAIDAAERFVLSTLGALWITDAHGELLRSIEGYVFASDQLHSVSVCPHPDGRRVIVDASGEAMSLYTTRDVWALDVDSDERTRLGDGSSYGTPWVAMDAKPIEFVQRPSASTTEMHRVLAPGSPVKACAVSDHDSVFTIHVDQSLKRYSLRPVEQKAPAAGVFVGGFDRVAGELCTWDRATRSVHRFDASDGAWLRSARGKHLEHEQLVLCEDGSIFVASAPETPLVAATIERSDARGAATFRADGDYELPRGGAVNRSGTHAAAVAQFHGLQLFSARESRVFSRDTPHRTWGGAACVRDDRVVSFDRDGLVVGWAPDSIAPVFSVRVEKTPCAIVGCRDGRSFALLLERGSRALELLWLDADTGAVLQRSQRAEASIGSTLVEREDQSVASAGVPPVVFDRATGEARVAKSVGPAYCAHLDARGGYALVQSFEHDYSVLDLEADVLRRLPDSQTSAVYAVTSYPTSDGARFVATGLGGQAFVIDAVAARVIERRELHPGRVLALASTRDGARVLSAGTDGVVRVYDGETFTVTSEHPGPRTAVFVAGFDEASAPAQTAFVWGSDERDGHGLWAYDLARSGSCERRAIIRGGDCALSSERPQRGRWSLASSTRAVRFDLRRERLDAVVPVTGRHVQRSLLSNCGRWLVLTDVVHSWLVDLERGTERALGKMWGRRSPSAIAERARVASLVMAIDGTLRAVALEDGAERFCAALAEAPAKIEQLAIALDALVICAVASSAEPRAARWVEARSLDDGSSVWKRALGQHAVTALAVDHGRVACGDGDGRVCVFDAGDGEALSEWDTTERIEDLGILDAKRLAAIDGAGQLYVLTE